MRNFVGARIHKLWANRLCRRDLVARLAGTAVLAGAGGLTVFGGLEPQTEAIRSPVEYATGLSSFMLACFGMLLLMRGAALRDGWIAHLEKRAIADQNHPQPWAADLLAPLLAVEGRAAITAHLMLRQKAIARPPAPLRKPQGASSYSDTTDQSKGDAK